MANRCFAHVCLFQLRRDLAAPEWVSLDAYAARFRASATCLHYRFPQNVSKKGGGFDLILFSLFSDAAAKARYVADPLHDDLTRFMDGFVGTTVVSDSHEEFAFLNILGSSS